VARSTERFQPEAPAAFVRAVASLRDATFRPEVRVDEASAPKKLAPYSFALTADVVAADDDNEPQATGRLVLLHDPAGQDAWRGEFRLVTYLRAALDHDMGSDPLLPAVAWTWLTDAFAARSAAYTAASGTVTRVTSEGFGGMSGEPATSEVEIRASWTPLRTDLSVHAQAWGDALGSAAGLLPLPDGVVAIPRSRRRRAR
jgi:hypothetical protein